MDIILPICCFYIFRITAGCLYFELKQVVCQTLLETLRTKDGVRYESVQKYGFYERSVITVVDKTKCLSLRIQRIALTVRDPETGKLVVKRTIAPLPNILLRRYQYSPALIDVVLNVYLADKYPDIWELPICDRSIIDMLADPDWRKCVSADVLSIIEELFCSDTNVMSNPKAENRYARVMIRMQSPRFIARLKVTLARLRLDITDFDSIVKCFNDEKKPEEIARKLFFDYGTEIQPGALYLEQAPGGCIQVYPNTTGEESKVNVEAFFNTVHAHKDLVKSMFNL